MHSKWIHIGRKRVGRKKICPKNNQLKRLGRLFFFEFLFRTLLLFNIQSTKVSFMFHNFKFSNYKIYLGFDLIVQFHFFTLKTSFDLKVKKQISTFLLWILLYPNRWSINQAVGDKPVKLSEHSFGGRTRKKFHTRDEVWKNVEQGEQIILKYWKVILKWRRVSIPNFLYPLLQFYA